MICKLPSCTNRFLHWYRADRLDIGQVTEWEDQIGEENLVQTVAGLQPTNVGNQINNLPAVSFQTKTLTVASDMFSGRRQYLISWVTSKPPGGATVFFNYGTFPADLSLNIQTTNSANLQSLSTFMFPGTATDANLFSPVQDWFRVAVIFNGIYGTNAGKLRFFRDGVEQAIVFTGNAPEFMGTITDQTLTVGGSAPGVPSSSVFIPEIIFSTGGFNDMEEIGDYFSDKYNL